MPGVDAACLAAASGFFVHNLGCKVNRVESDFISASLLAWGARLVRRDEARLVVINSCTVTAEADTKTRKAIRQAHAAAAGPWVLVTGCAVALEQEAYRALGARVLIEPDRLRALERSAELLGLRAPAAAPLRQGNGFPTRLGLKVQDGCDCACSYCIVAKARGASRSELLTSLRAQVRAAQDAGVREVVLTGVNLGLYRSEGTGGGDNHSSTGGTGSDNDTGGTDSDNGTTTDLCGLIRTLLADTTQLRLRLSSLEPQHASDELLTLMAGSEGRLCAHLHLPLQSGSDAVLAQMARPYDVAFYTERVRKARRLMPTLALTTDIICGFPGERDEDFACSLALCRELGFTRLHVFRFSPRPGTPAAERADRIRPELIAQRARQMRQLADELARADAERRVGSCEWVVIETKGWGRAESYHRVAVPSSLAPGTLVPMRFTGCRDTLIQAEIETDGTATPPPGTKEPPWTSHRSV